MRCWGLGGGEPLPRPATGSRSAAAGARTARHPKEKAVVGCVWGGGTGRPQGEIQTSGALPETGREDCPLPLSPRRAAPGAEPWEGEGARQAGAGQSKRIPAKKTGGGEPSRPGEPPRRGRPVAGAQAVPEPGRGSATRTCGERRRLRGSGGRAAPSPAVRGSPYPPRGPAAAFQWVRGAGAAPPPGARQVEPGVESIPQAPQELCKAAQKPRVFKHLPWCL